MSGDSNRAGFLAWRSANLAKTWSSNDAALYMAWNAGRMSVLPPEVAAAIAVVELDMLLRQRQEHKKLSKEEAAMKKPQAIELARVQYWAEVEAGLAAEKQVAAQLHQGGPVAAQDIPDAITQVTA